MEKKTNKAPITPGMQRRLDNLKKYQWKKGQSGNLKGKKPNGLSLMQFGRQFLLQVPEDEQKSRLLKQWNALHKIASDPENKNCVAANGLMMSYSFGPPVPEVSVKIAALQVFQSMKPEAQQYIAMQLTAGDDTYVIPENELEPPPEVIDVEVMED